MAQTLTLLLTHVVFSTKDRAGLITPAIEPNLYSYIGGICSSNKSPLLAAGGTANHIHLLVSLGKTVALCDLLLEVKRDSSKWIKTKGREFDGFQWQEGYGGFSIGHTQVPAVKRYFARQKEKHRSLSFEDELLAFLHKYGIDYDPEHIWT